MKTTYIMSGLLALSLIGCASNQQAVERSFFQAENTQALAAEFNLDSASTSSAANHLDSAKTYKADAKKSQEAINAAEMSALEYRLALINAERDSLHKEDARLEGELRNDVERKLLYQNILDNESKEGK